MLLSYLLLYNSFINQSFNYIIIIFFNIMELFLKPHTWDTFFLQLIVSYLKLQQKNKVKIIQLSQGALLAIGEGKLKLSTPSLITSNGEIYQDTLKIASKLIEQTQWTQFFYGSTTQQKQQIHNVQKHNKPQKQILKYLQKYLESRTFFVSNHLTLADIYIFTKVHDILTEFTDQQKSGFNHIFRWYKHIQNLAGIKQFLIETGRGFVSDPKFNPSILASTDKKKK